MEDEEKLCLGAVILVEGILMGVSNTEKIPHTRLMCTSDFDLYCSQPWGKYAFSILSESITKMNAKTWEKSRYDVKGFALALHLWALSAVPLFGTLFAQTCMNSEAIVPLCLRWTKTAMPRIQDIVSVGNHFDVSYQVKTSLYIVV